MVNLRTQVHFDGKKIGAMIYDIESMVENQKGRIDVHNQPVMTQEAPS